MVTIHKATLVELCAELEDHVKCIVPHVGLLVVNEELGRLGFNPRRRGAWRMRRQTKGLELVRGDDKVPVVDGVVDDAGANLTFVVLDAGLEGDLGGFEGACGEDDGLGAVGADFVLEEVVTDNTSGAGSIARVEGHPPYSVVEVDGKRSAWLLRADVFDQDIFEEKVGR